MLPSACGMPAMPRKLSVLMSASEALTSAATRALSATFTFSMAPSRVLSTQHGAVRLLDLAADAARLLRQRGARRKA